MSNINDGAIPYASRHLDFYAPTTAGASGTQSSYSVSVKKFTGVMSNIRVNRPMRDVNQYNEAVAPSGSYGTDDFITGSGTVQLPFDPAKSGNTIASLVPGDGFNCKFDTTIGAEQFYILSSDNAEDLQGFKVQNVTFKKLYNISNVPATV